MALQQHEREKYVQEIVRRLRSLALTYRSAGDQKRASAARRAARQLDEWWKKGGKGSVPVDLTEFGMDDVAEVFALWAEAPQEEPDASSAEVPPPVAAEGVVEPPPVSLPAEEEKEKEGSEEEESEPSLAVQQEPQDEVVITPEAHPGAGEHIEDIAKAEPSPAEPAEAAAKPAAEEVVVEDDERTDLGSRHIAKLRQLLRQGQYEEAYAQATEVLKENLSDVQRSEAEQIRNEARDNLVAQWMAKANEAYQGERWEDVLTWVRKVLLVAPEHKDAGRLRQEADEQLERAEHMQDMAALLRRVTDMLQKETGVDISAMEQLVREAEASVGQWREEGLLDSKAGRTLEALLQELRARFDKKREEQGSKTTAEAAKTYQSVVEAIPAMEAALRQGEKTWWDDRSGAYRPITELLDERRARLPELARDLALRHYEKAEAALEVHRPKEAQEEVGKGLALVSVPADVYADLEALQVKVKAELEKWEKADALLQQASQETSIPKRWSLLRQAAEVYPEHPDVVSARERALEDVIAWAEGEIADRLSTLSSLIEQDKFKEAYRALNRLRTTIKKLALREEDAEALFEKIEEGEETVKAAEERRKDIRALASKIRDLLQQGEVSQAREIYLRALATHSDWENDRDFGPLGDEIRAKLGDHERLEEARRLYERGEWEKARRTIEPITSTELASEVERLRAAIAVAEAIAEIQALWERGYYYETLPRIEGVLTSRGEYLSEKDRQRLEEYKAEIERRRAGDQDVWQALSKVGLRSFEVLANEAEWKKEITAQLTTDVEGFSRVVRIHRALEEALKVPSTLEGYLRDADNRLERWVRKHGKQIITGLKKEGKWGLVREWLDTWTENWRHVERRWREQLYKEYFEQRARQLEQEEAWDDLVDMWIEAQSVLPNVFEFVSREREARRARLLAKARANLATGRPEDTKEALEALEDEREVWDDIVRAAHYLVNRLYDLDSKLEMGQLEGIQAFRDGILEEWQRQKEAHVFLSKDELAEILDKRFVLAAQKLLKRGDEVREENPQEALIAYARGLQLPLPPDQQEILRKRLEAFGHLAQRYVADLAQALNRVQVVSNRSLVEQLETVKSLRAQGWALIGVLSVILSPQEKAQWEKSLREGLRRAEAVIEALEEALEVWRRYQEGGQAWAAVLREGKWAQVEQDIASAVEKMHTTPQELVALQQRVEEAKKQRQELILLRDKADAAYREEDFETGIRSINAIRKLLGSLGVTPENEPFHVVRQMHVFDIEQAQMIEGVDAIYSLLEARYANARAWETWRDALHEAKEVLQPQVDRLRNWLDPEPTAVEVQLIDTALAACREALEQGANPPQESPMSDRARKAQEEGEKIKKQIEDWRIWLEEHRKERWVDMAALIREAYTLVDAGNADDAALLIEKGLHYQPGHEFLTYLKRVNEDYQNMYAASGGFLGRFFGGR